jgi:hypothetical protein
VILECVQRRRISSCEFGVVFGVSGPWYAGVICFAVPHFLSYILFPRWTSYQLRISFLPASIDMFPTFAWFSTPWILHCSAPVYIFAFPLFLGLVWTLVCFSFVLHLLFGGDGVEEAF